MEIHIVNGPNLNLLGLRASEIYGTQTLPGLIQTLREKFPTLRILHFQSNYEGELIDYLQKIGFQQDVGIVLNPGALTHTSIALGDTLEAISAPIIEVHLSDIYHRETFRQVNYIKAHCLESYVGNGAQGYASAIEKLIDLPRK